MKVAQLLAAGLTAGLAWARGDRAPGRALGNCQRPRTQPCTPYAVDDRMVWPTTADASR